MMVIYRKNWKAYFIDPKHQEEHNRIKNKPFYNIQYQEWEKEYPNAAIERQEYEKPLSLKGKIFATIIIALLLCGLYFAFSYIMEFLFFIATALVALMFMFFMIIDPSFLKKCGGS